MARWINRAALLVRPRKPLLDWAGAIDDEAPEHVKGDLAHKISIYLVAEDPNEENETAPIKNYFEEIFDTELAAWCPDEDIWPQNRTLKMFYEWFEVIGESIIVDLEPAPIRAENIPA